MKKLLALLSAAIMILGFAGCADKTTAETEPETSTNTTAETQAESAVSTADIMNRIREGGYLPETTTELTSGDMNDYYGIDASEIKQCSAILNSSGWQDELVIIEATDSDAAADAASHLESHIQNQCDEMKNYDATMYDIVKKCEVVTNGNYVAMFISKDYQALNDIFNSYFA